METFDNRIILVVLGVLVAATNVVVEVLKKVLWDLIPTNFLVILVAESLTLGSGFACAAIVGATVLWYHVAAAIVAGMLVAYAAMLGFDKLHDGFQKLTAMPGFGKLIESIKKVLLPNKK